MEINNKRYADPGGAKPKVLYIERSNITTDFSHATISKGGSGQGPRGSVGEHHGTGTQAKPYHSA